MKHLTTILLTLIIVLSCEKNNQCIPNSQTLIGSWIWVKSAGGFGGGTTTPELTGERIIIEFTANSNYRQYLNGSIIAQSKFTIGFDPKINKSILYFDGLTSLSIQFIDCNNLILDEIHLCDGYIYTYKRLH